jgi:ribosomal peptide maturation radical SAM protein 1
MVDMPSIQLATLEAALRRQGLAADIIETCPDFARQVGVDLYRRFTQSAKAEIKESIFSRLYFRDHAAHMAEVVRREAPYHDVQVAEYDRFVEAAPEFLERTVRWYDWRTYDVVGISLTLSQMGAALALAGRLKEAHPHLRIVLGGAACAGPSGRVLEGEDVFPELVRRLRSGQTYDDLPGISFKATDGIRHNPPGPLHHRPPDWPFLSYDAYFSEIRRLGLERELDVWIPFESSRGCWYGEKVQCTFCGLHEIMQSRRWEPAHVMAEMKHLASKYDVTQFMAVDLILPHDYFDTFLAQLAEARPGWRLFYELKSNITRKQVQRLVEAGVTWFQPGIESLDGKVLSLIRKGCTPTQNVQTLKWAQEYGAFPSWGFVAGVPGEDADCYDKMARLMPRLHHLAPPLAQARRFFLSRFSPYHENPEAFGLSDLRPPSLSDVAFPIEAQALNDLIYEFQYTVDGASFDVDAGLEKLNRAIARWKAAYGRGASLWIEQADSGGGFRIVDTRTEETREHALSQAEAVLYAYLDSSKKEAKLEETFSQAHPAEAAELRSRGGVEPLLAAWYDAGLVLRDGGRILALGLYVGPHNRRFANPPVQIARWWPLESPDLLDPSDDDSRESGVTEHGGPKRDDRRDVIQLGTRVPTIDSEPAQSPEPPPPDDRFIERGGTRVRLFLTTEPGPALARALGHGMGYREKDLPAPLREAVIKLGRAFGQLAPERRPTAEVWATLEQLTRAIAPDIRISLVEPQPNPKGGDESETSRGG